MTSIDGTSSTPSATAASTLRASAGRVRGQQSFAAALKDAAAGESAKASGVQDAPFGETYADVAGRGYDEIVSGPRNGMFVNQSGNGRHGQAFTRVERDGREFHIYGSGRDRHVISVRPRSAAADATSS
jgi:hypothetical protein